MAALDRRLTTQLIGIGVLHERNTGEASQRIRLGNAGFGICSLRGKFDRYQCSRQNVKRAPMRGWWRVWLDYRDAHHPEGRREKGLFEGWRRADDICYRIPAC